MLGTSLYRFLHRVSGTPFRNRGPGRPRGMRRFRPRVEAFEERMVPSTVFWTNPSGGNWSTASNWSSGSLPGITDDVVIDVPNNVTITHSAGFDAIHSLACNDTLQLTGGFLSIATDSALDGDLSMSGGVLTGAGNLDLNGFFTWSGGNMIGPGSTSANGGMKLDASSQDLTLDGRVLNNTANAIWTGAGRSVSLVHGAVFDNLGGATVEVQGNFGFGLSPSGTVNNAGDFVKAADASGASIGVPFNNSGTVEVLGGTLTLAGGVSSGAFTVAQGATLQFRLGSDTFTPDSSVTGDGAFVVAGQFGNPPSVTVNVLGSYDIASTTLSGGTLNFISDATLPTLTMTGGTLGGFGQVTVQNSLSWLGGKMSGPGHTVLQGQATIAGNAFDTPTLDGRTFDNAGTVTLTGGTLAMTTDAVFNNLVGATFVDNTNGGSIGTPGLFSTFNNAGTFRKRPSSLRTTLDTTLNNSGTVELQGGALSVNGTTNYSSASQTLSGGIYLIGGTLQLNFLSSDGLRNNDATIVLDGPAARISTFFLQNAFNFLSTNLDAGTLVLQNGASLSINSFQLLTNLNTVFVGPGSTLVAAGGYLQVAGTTTLNGGTLRAPTVNIQAGILDGSGTIIGNVINAGQVTPGGDGTTGILTVQGNYTQTSVGDLVINLGGLAPGAQYSRLAVTGVATLDGTLDVLFINDFLPDAGNSFQILTFGSRNGDFATMNLPGFGDDRFLDPVYDANSLTLVTRSSS